MDDDVQAEDRGQDPDQDALTVPLTDDERAVLDAALGGV